MADGCTEKRTVREKLLGFLGWGLAPLQRSIVLRARSRAMQEPQFA